MRCESYNNINKGGEEVKQRCGLFDLTILGSRCKRSWLPEVTTMKE